MNLTEFFRLRKPEGTDPVDVADFNDNFDVIDTALNERPTKTGAASDMIAAFVQAESRVNLVSGEKLATSLGKIMKFFADLKTVAFTGSYTDLSSKPTIPSGAAANYSVANNDTTTASGYVADARIVKTHGDEIDQISSDLSGVKSSFQAGCDTLVAACKTMGVTPASNSPADIASAIKKIVTSASGSYTNSRSSTHTINCGFKPSKVVLFNGNTGRRDVVIYDSRLSTSQVYAAYSNSGVTLDNMVDGSIYPSLDLVLTSTGFTVGYAAAYEGDTMYWLAIK